MAMSILSGILGNAFKIEIKKGFKIPTVLFYCDIRHKGQGKSPAINKLQSSIRKVQKNQEKQYCEELEEYKRLKALGEEAQEPKQIPALLVDDFTMEALADNLSHSGGTISGQHELSGFFNAANQYKGGKGNDNEKILNLKDGYSQTIKRKGKQVTIDLVMAVFGGIQPQVWKRTFNNSVHSENGAVERFLYTYEDYKFFYESGEIWDDNNRNCWETILTNALSWYEKLKENPEEQYLKFSPHAFRLYQEWEYKVKNQSLKYPEIIRGYINKIISDCHRIAGLLQCLDCFKNSSIITGEISGDTYQKAIEITEFYFSEFINVMAVLVLDEEQSLNLDDSEIKNLASTLMKIKDQKNEDNYLKFKDIRAAYNKQHKANIKPTSKKIGQLIEKAGLNKTRGQGNYKNKSGKWERATCLICDDKLNTFLNYYSKGHIQHNQHNQTTGNIGSQLSYDEHNHITNINKKEENNKNLVMTDMMKSHHNQNESTDNKDVGYHGYDSYDVSEENNLKTDIPSKELEFDFDIPDSGEI
ncbi:MAG: DUF3987 domain-containing protein [Bacteroidota bacterium]